MIFGYVEKRNNDMIVNKLGEIRIEGNWERVG